MLEPDVVDRIRELSGQGLGANGLLDSWGSPRNSVRRYLAGATVGFQERLAARRFDGPTLSEVHQLFGTVAEGNTSSFSRNWPPEGSISTCGPCNGPWRRCVRRNGPGRWPLSGSSPTGRPIQIDFGEKVVPIAGQPVKVYLMTAVLGHSTGLLPALPSGPATARGPGRSLPTFEPRRAGPL